MDKSNHIPEHRLQLGILSVTEHHAAIPPAELGFDNKGPSALQAYEFHGGSRLKLLSVFEILNRPRISGIQ
jgi:hypothetical protein